MIATVTVSEAQKNFGEWHERALREPVRITRRGRETTFLISAETYRELWESFRKAVRVGDLSEAEMSMTMTAEIARNTPTTDALAPSD